MHPTGSALDSLSPAAYRDRYLEFKRVALEAAAAFVPETTSQVSPHTLHDGSIVAQTTIPLGWYWSVRLERGQTLRIHNTSGTPGVSVLFWNADDTSERYNAGDTIKIQWNARLTTGRLLFSDMGRVLATIAEDTSGRHDTLLGGSTRASAVARGDTSPHPRNTRENFLLAAAKHGLEKRDVPPCVTFFAGVATTDDGHFAWHDDPTPAGRHVDLVAAMNVLVALSNSPHPLAPATRHGGPVDAFVFRSRSGGDHIDGRHATGEATRAFENTNAMFAR